jgi:negative regulator of sigma E activity
MNAETLEVLSGFVDGESVDPEALAAALLSPGGREALLDFARLRSAIAADDTRPSPAFYGRMAEVLQSTRPGVVLHVAGWRRFAAAAVVALAALGLVDLGLRLRNPRGVEKPPRPDRVLQFQPGVDWKATSR